MGGRRERECVCARVFLCETAREISRILTLVSPEEGAGSASLVIRTSVVAARGQKPK